MHDAPWSRRRSALLSCFLGCVSNAIFFVSRTATAPSHFPNVFLVVAMISTFSGVCIALALRRTASAAAPAVAVTAMVINLVGLFLWLRYIWFWAINMRATV